MKPAREDLQVLWHGDWQPGLLLYALREPGRHWPFVLPPTWHGWSGAHPHVLYGDGWEVEMWTIAVDHWPSQERFDAVLRESFAHLIAQGSRVTWVSLEGCFVDPPSLFGRPTMSGCIYAAMGAGIEFQTAIRLDEPLEALPDDILDELRAASIDIIGAESQGH